MSKKMWKANRVRKREPSDHAFPPPDHERFKSFMYRVKDGDSFESLAATYHALDAWDLIYHNFQTFVPEEVNWCLDRYVGCRHTTDEWNYCFSSKDSPGEISIPRYDLVRKQPTPAPQNDDILKQRWYKLTDDIEEGRRILKGILDKAHTEVKLVASLPAMPKTCRPSAKSLAKEGVKAYLSGPSPLTLAKQIGCSFINVGIANQSGDVAAARDPLYFAFAEGVASVIDPKRRLAVFENRQQRIFYHMGKMQATSLNSVQRHQLMVALIENERNYGLGGFSPIVKKTYDDFRGQYDGGTAVIQIGHELARRPYRLD